MNVNVSAHDGDSRRVSNVITKLTQNDILLGRGAPIINYEGNVRFRALVSTRKTEYNSTGRHQIKDEIAREIVMEVKRRNGRFLRKLESNDSDVRQAGIPEAQPAWAIADEDVILKKVKQALRDKEPDKRIAQSKSLDSAANAPDIPQNLGISRSLPVLPTSENVSWARQQHLPLLQNSLYRQIALSSLLPQSSFPSSPNTMLSVSAVARPHSENDLDILRQQQQHMQQRSLISHIPSVSQLSNEYLHALLQRQSQNTASLATLSTRTDHGVPSNETLMSMLRADFDRTSDTSRNLPTMGTNQQDFDEMLRALLLSRQNQNVSVVGGTMPSYSALGLSNNTTNLNSLRALQQYTTAVTARREQQRHELLQRQILLDPNIPATYLATVPHITSNVPASQNSDGILIASLPMGQSPSHHNATTMRSATERYSSKSGDSKDSNDGVSVAQSNSEGRKRNASGDTESSGASSTIEGTKKKARVHATTTTTGTSSSTGGTHKK
jgi:hypothetical protein